MSDPYHAFIADLGLRQSRETDLLERALREVENEVLSTDARSDPFLTNTQLGEYWVATALATGALQWAGGSIMQNLFGSSSAGADIAAIVEAAVRRLAGIIRQEIENNALRQSIASVDATRTNFLDHLRAPSDLRLELTTNDATRAVADLRTLGLAGHPSYMGAVSLRLVILQERARRDFANRKGELENIVVQINQGIEHHDAMSRAWERWNRERYVLHTECRGDFCGLWVIKDGVVIFKIGNRGRAQRDKFVTEHSAATFKEEVHPTYVAPGDEVIHQWVSIRNAINLSIDQGNTDLGYIAEITAKLAAGVHPTEL